MGEGGLVGESGFTSTWRRWGLFFPVRVSKNSLSLLHEEESPLPWSSSWADKN